jgi:adenylate cyclase
MRNTGTSPPLDEIRIVEIDILSVNQLGNWPWHRSLIGRVVDSIARCGPRVIGVNILFPASRSDQSNREANRNFGDIVFWAQNVVFPFQLGRPLDQDIKLVVLPPDYILASRLPDLDTNVGAGFPGIYQAREIFYSDTNIARFSLPTGHSNLIKQECKREVAYLMQFGRDSYTNFALQMARLYRGLKPSDIRLQGHWLALGDIRIPLDNAGRGFIKYRGPARTFRHYSAFELLAPNFNKAELQGKIVLLGITDKELPADFTVTPTDPAMPAVEVWATITENILHGDFIRSLYFPWSLLEIGLIFLAGLLGPFLLLRIRGRWRWFFWVGVNLTLIAGAALLFQVNGIWIKVFWPLVAFWTGSILWFRLRVSPAAGANTLVQSSPELSGSMEAVFGRDGRLVKISRYLIVDRVERIALRQDLEIEVVQVEGE